MSETVRHSATFNRVVRFRGTQHFGYDVTCSCGWKCSQHYKAGPAARCSVRHEKASRRQS